MTAKSNTFVAAALQYEKEIYEQVLSIALDVNQIILRHKERKQ